MSSNHDTSMNILYTDLCIVTGTGGLLLLSVELLLPGLVSSLIDITAIFVAAFCLGVLGVSFNLFSVSWTRWQRLYATVMVALSALAYLVSLSLQLKGHLLGLGSLVVIFLTFILSIYLFYDRRRQN